MRKYVFTLMTIMYSLLIVAEAPAPSNGTLLGYVYDAITNEPITRAEISVNSGNRLIKRMLSMNNGRYFSAFRPLSNYQVKVQKSGYETMTKGPLTIPKDGRARHDFYLMPKDITFTFHLSRGSNLVSLPLVVNNMSLGDIFQDMSAAFQKSESGYYNIVNKNETIRYGVSYIIIIPENNSYSVVGKPVNILKVRIPKNTWRLIPSVIGTAIPKSNPEYVISQLIGNANGTYYVANEMVEGNAYYIKTTEDSEIIIDSRTSSFWPFPRKYISNDQ